MNGKVSKFFNDKGFGFIVPDAGGEDQFFHITGCQEGYEPREGDKVSFEIGRNPRSGKDRAEDVTPI